MKLVFLEIFFVITIMAETGGMATDDVMSLTDYVRDYDQILDTVYSNYPKYNRSLGLTPPPHGSDLKIEPHPYSKESNIQVVYTTVDMLVSTKRIVKMGIEQQSVIVKVEESYGWNDMSLNVANIIRNSSADLNLKSMVYEKDKVWTPPIFASNILEEKVIREKQEVFCWLNGYCFMEHYVQYTIPCTVNVRDFPFDVHNCTLMLSQPHNLNTR